MGCGNGRGEALLLQVQAPGLQLAGGAGGLSLLLQVEGEPLVVPALLPLAVGFGAGVLGLAVGFLLGEVAQPLVLLVLLLADGLGLRGFLQFDFGEPIRQAAPVGRPRLRNEDQDAGRVRRTYGKCMR